MRIPAPSPEDIAGAEKTLRLGTWGITAGAVLYSVLTVTPLVARVTPGGAWQYTAPILPLVVDAAVIVSVRLDATVARLGEKGGGWATLLRWMTGLMTLGLNIGDSALKGDRVGVAVHAVIPLILIVIADAGLAWRRAINRALDRIAREQTAERAREQRETEAREQRERDDRERERLTREQADREQREHDEQQQREAREHAERLAREQADRESAECREQREHEAQQQREEREERARVRQEEQQRADRERADQQAATERREAQQRRDAEQAGINARAERALREQAQRAVNIPVNTTEYRPVNTRTKAPVNAASEPKRPSVNAPVNKPVNTTPPPVNKLPEDEARAVVAAPVNTDKTLRQLADMTGWSLGWITARRQELREEVTA